MNTVAPELHPIPVVSPQHHIGIDFVGPISPPSPSGSKRILTISDCFAKFVEAFPMESKHAEGIAAALFKVRHKGLCTFSMFSFTVVVCEDGDPSGFDK